MPLLSTHFPSSIFTIPTIYAAGFIQTQLGSSDVDGQVPTTDFVTSSSISPSMAFSLSTIMFSLTPVAPTLTSIVAYSIDIGIWAGEDGDDAEPPQPIINTKNHPTMFILVAICYSYL